MAPKFHDRSVDRRCRMRRVPVWFLVSATGFASAAIASPGARGDDWEVYQHDAQHTGRSSAFINPESLELAWQAPVGFSVPLVAGDTVYSLQNAQGTGTISHIGAFRLDDGAMKWVDAAPYNFSFSSQLAYGNGLLVYSAIDPATQSASLHVLDAATGSTIYTLPVGGNLITIAPAVAPGGPVVAYLGSDSGLVAVELGKTSGRLLWFQVAETGTGGFSAPSIIGQSVLLAGPDQYYAFDRATGAVNHFHIGPTQGGGGDTPVVDVTRDQFYILDAYNGPTPTLTAYNYTDNTHITRLWQRVGAGISTGNQVALGRDGQIYVAAADTLLELDPADGHTIRSLNGQSFAGGTAPIISDGYLWDSSKSQMIAYDLSTLLPAFRFSGSRGDLATPYEGIGAVVDGHLVEDFGNLYGFPGFRVYSEVPEPSVVLPSLAAVVMVGFHRRRKINVPWNRPTARGWVELDDLTVTVANGSLMSVCNTI